MMKHTVRKFKPAITTVAYQETAPKDGYYKHLVILSVFLSANSGTPQKRPAKSVSNLKNMVIGMNNSRYLVTKNI